MKKIRTKTLFLISAVLTCAVCLCNMYISKDVVQALDLPIIFTVITVIFASVFSIFVLGIELMIVIYFALAALGEMQHIKNCYTIAFRALVWYPLVQIINMIGLVFFKYNIAEQGIRKIVFYIPFMILVGLSIRRNISNEMKIQLKKERIVSMIGILASGLILI